MAAKKQQKSRTFKQPVKAKPRSIEALNEMILGEFMRIGLVCERPEVRFPIDIILKSAFVIGQIFTNFDSKIVIHVGTHLTGQSVFTFTEDGICIRNDPYFKYATWTSGLHAVLHALDRVLKGIEKTACAARHQASNGRWRYSKAA